MFEYVVYVRTKEGYVERKGCATFVCYWSQVPYPHGEIRVGWPFLASSKDKD